MARIVGHHVLMPRLAGLSLGSGLIGTKHGQTGFVGQLWYHNAPLVGFDVYGPGQIRGSNLSRCDGSVSTPAVTPKGRSVCWIHESNGYVAVRYVSEGLLYEAYSGDSIIHASDDRSWALALVDTYS